MPSSVADAIRTVIVLDDDMFVCRALKTQLGVLGFNVVTYSSAEELLTNQMSCSEACLLLDVYLPGISGIELASRLKASGVFIPTILMSGRDDAETVRLMRSAQPVACLFKPFAPIALEEALSEAARHLAKSDVERE
jgi:FixJ family two-component response regulator